MFTSCYEYCGIIFHIKRACFQVVVVFLISSEISMNKNVNLSQNIPSFRDLYLGIWIVLLFRNRSSFKDESLRDVA